MKLSDDFNGADLRNVCTEAGRFMHVSSFIIPADCVDSSGVFQDPTECGAV